MPGTLDFDSIAELLNAEFMQRKHRNQAYSLRAFARDLDVNLASLSSVMRGKQGLSEKAVSAIAQNLKLKASEREFVKDLVLCASARNPRVRELARERIEEARKQRRLRPLKDEEFRVIADWYHAAILELTQVVGFDPSADWIAGQLGIEESEAVAALSRLERLGLLRRSQGTWVAAPEAYDAYADRPTAATRKFLRQVIGLSLTSLFEDPLEERETLGMIVALPRSRLPEFRAEMRKFVSDFWLRIENEPKDGLYALGLQLSPVKNRKKAKRADDAHSVGLGEREQ